MPTLATPQIREAPHAPESQLPLIDIQVYKATNDHFTAWARKRVATGLLPMLGVAVIIGINGALRPRAVIGSILLCVEVALAYLSMYMLWPRQNKSRR